MWVRNHRPSLYWHLPYISINHIGDTSMKRLNPKTNKPFRRGDLREDGKVFSRYKPQRITPTGYYYEEWTAPETIVKENKRRRTYCPEQYNRWRLKNLGVRNSISAKYRASQLQRTPKWLSESQLTEIKDFYKKAVQMGKQTGIKYHVDHIVPLQGTNVSGLHVPWNLQILTALENCTKKNTFI